MPCTWSHIYFIAFIIAIILFVCENSAIIICRAATDNILNYFNFSAFNLNYWISFIQFYFVLLFVTLFYKFIYGNIDKEYLYTLIYIRFTTTKGLIIQTIFYNRSLD